MVFSSFIINKECSEVLMGIQDQVYFEGVIKTHKGHLVVKGFSQ